MDKSQKIALAVAIALPILLAIVVALMVYIPQQSVKPTFNFIYATGNSNYDFLNNEVYSVAQNKINENPLRPEQRNYSKNYTPDVLEATRRGVELYLFDVKSWTSRQLTLAEVKQLRLDRNFTSPDGYELSRGDTNYSYRSDIPFVVNFAVNGRNNLKVVNKETGAGREVQLKDYRGGNRGYYYGSGDNFSFMGWVLP